MSRKLNYVGALHPKANIFDLTHSNMFSCNMGKLYPFLLQETLPGDKFSIKTNMLIRLAPQVFPTMHQVDAYIHYFYVPDRILMDKWEEFITGGEDGDTDVVAPYLKLPTPDPTKGYQGTLLDYMGIPNQLNSNIKVSALPFRAYVKIFNDWFRDEDLVEEVPMAMTDGEDSVTSLDLLTRAWEKDYFTSARPSAQKGPTVRVPLSGSAPVYGKYSDNSAPFRGMLVSDIKANSSDEGTGSYDIQSLQGYQYPSQLAGLPGYPNFDPFGGKPVNIVSKERLAVYNANHPTKQLESTVYADLSDVTATSINDLRLAWQTQKFFERNMRCGSRYTEFVQSHWGFKPSDGRLQRSQFLGSEKFPVVFSEVVQTSGSDASSPQGNLAGHGVSFNIKGHCKYFCQEHGYIIGLLSVLPRTNYMQGIHRTFTRETRFDYFLPEFQHIGEQGVKQKEIYANSTDPEKTFGYQARYNEYRTHSSSVHGEFRGNLKSYHMARIFDSDPALNAEFVQSNPTTRIFAVESDVSDKLYVESLIRCKAMRLMTSVAEPGFVDHN